jgi:hypothetical protein
MSEINLATQRKELMQKIIAKGGLFGMAAEFHLADADKSNGLVKEFFDQCHNRSLWEFWGRDLVLELVRYRIRLLRSQFEEVYANPVNLQRS